MSCSKGHIGAGGGFPGDGFVEKVLFLVGGFVGRAGVHVVFGLGRQTVKEGVVHTGIEDG